MFLTYDSNNAGSILITTSILDNEGNPCPTTDARLYSLDSGDEWNISSGETRDFTLNLTGYAGDIIITLECGNLSTNIKIIENTN